MAHQPVQWGNMLTEKQGGSNALHHGVHLGDPMALEWNSYIFLHITIEFQEDAYGIWIPAPMNLMLKAQGMAIEGLPVHFKGHPYLEGSSQKSQLESSHIYSTPKNGINHN